MPTATRLSTETSSTLSKSGIIIPLNAAQLPSLSFSSSSHGTSAAEATLRSLYSRAARSFLHRELVLTEHLLDSAFSLLPPPSASPNDPLSAHRKKWDILRVTLEATAYAAPPPDSSTLPPRLRANLTQVPHALLESLYTRSLRLFTARSSAHQPNPAFLPAQVLATLMLGALKLRVPDVARGMVEDWLARRGQVEEVLEDQDGYEQIIELYCCEVLPRLEQWDYAKEFLEHESQMGSEMRERLKATFHTLYTRHLEASRAARSPPARPSSPAAPPTIPTRSPSPASSTSSSSLSTTSTHTVVPRTPRPCVRSASRSRSSSTSSVSTAIVYAHPTRNTTHADADTGDKSPKSPHRSHTHGHTNGSARLAFTLPPSRSSPTSTSQMPPPREPHQLRGSSSMLAPIATMSTTSTGATRRAYVRLFLPLLACARASLGPFLLLTPRVAMALLLFVVLPLLSFLLRVRRRQRLLRAVAKNNGNTVVANVQRRLLMRGSSGAGMEGSQRLGKLLKVAWTGIFRGVLDTVRMGGSGLV